MSDFYLQRENPDKEYIFLPKNVLKNQRMFSKTAHISGYKEKISKFCEVEILQTKV